MSQNEETHSFGTRILPSWCLGTGLIGGVFAVIYHPPVSMLFGCGQLLLGAAVLTGCLALGLRAYAEPKLKSSAHPNFARILFYGSPLPLFFALLVFTNAKFDPSPVSEHEATIEFKSSRSTKQGMRYYVDVPAPPGMSGPLGEAVTLPVDREIYERVALEQTKVKFKVRSGWLKVPWREGHEIMLETLSQTPN